MNILEKIVRSWWILVSLIIFLNGLGFIYLGIKTENRLWVLEGITYEIPWLFLIAFVDNSIIFGALCSIAFLLLLIGFVRSLWVDMKYLNMLETHI